MKIAKVLALSLTILMFASLFSGCNQTGKTDGGSVTSAAAADKKITLTFALWNQSAVPGLEDVTAVFTQKNPNITIDIQVTPWVQYWEKMQTAAAGGSLADILWMNGPNVGKYTQGNILMPLDDRIKNDNLDMNNYPETIVKLYNVNGVQYAIPKDFDVIVLFYNKALFDQAGIAYPDKTWTWDKMVEAAEKLTDKDKGIYGMASPIYNQATYYNTIAQCGGYVISEDKKTSGYDNPNTIRGIQCWVDLITKGISPTLEQMTDTSPDAMFESGKLAMIYQGQWMAIEYMNSAEKDNIDLTVLPSMDKKATIIHGMGYAIWANTKYPDEAWKFVSYMGSQEPSDIIAKTGSCLPAYKASDKYVLEAFPTINMQAALDQLDYAVTYPVSQQTAKWQQVEADYLKLAYAGTMSVEEACKAIAVEMNKILAEENR